MDALINLKDCREYMTVQVNNENHKVRLAGTLEDPYFCGKDVCIVLGYKDYKDAMKKHVEKEDKSGLRALDSFSDPSTGTNLGGVPDPPQMCSRLGLTHYTFREGQMIYISEAGVYSLIFSSQAPFAKEFRNLVCKTILPSIRKYGSYQIEKHLMEQLSIKEETEKELHDKLVKAERKSLRINKFMRRVTVKERKMEWIYIATTSMYASERIFKIGSTTRLSSRIGAYNTGRPQEDVYYYCWVVKCYNSKDVDYHIQKLLSEFKHRDGVELYCGINFRDLKDIILYIVENYDRSVDYISNFIKYRLDKSLDEEDEDPPRLDCKKITYQIGEHTETIDLESEDIEIIREELENMLAVQKRMVGNAVMLDRKDLVSRISKATNTSKKDLWYRIKEMTGWVNSKDPINHGECTYKIIY